MSSAIKMSHILMEANAALVETLVKALREVGHAPTVSTLPRFLGRTDSPGDPTIDEWLSPFDLYVRQCGVAEGDRAVLLYLAYISRLKPTKVFVWQYNNKRQKLRYRVHYATKVFDARTLHDSTKVLVHSDPSVVVVANYEHAARSCG